MNPLIALEFVAILACTLFTGAAIYISAVEHPARLSCGVDLALAQWVPSYKRATVMQASLALLSGFCAIARAVAGGGFLWFCGAALILAVVPFTLIVIRPTNNRLLDRREARPADETLRLLQAWGRLHLVRGALSLVASVLFVWAAIH